MRLLKNHKTPLDKVPQIAPCSVRKSAITSAIETIGKLSSRKKLPPIVLQQRGIRRRAQKLSQVDEVAQQEGSTPFDLKLSTSLKRPKTKHTVRPKGGSLIRHQPRHSPIKAKYGRNLNRHRFFRRLENRPSAAAYSKKNRVMDQYQF